MLKFAKKAINSLRKTVSAVLDKASATVVSVQCAIENPTAEGYVDSGVKILIAVVIGALLLAGLYALFNTTIMPTVTKKVTDLFNYNGK